MSNNQEHYNGLANPTWKNGEPLDLSDHRKPAKPKAVNTEPAPPPSASLPSKYIGKKWQELYQSDDLETIRTKYPAHYEKLKNERFNPEK